MKLVPSMQQAVFSNPRRLGNVLGCKDHWRLTRGKRCTVYGDGALNEHVCI